MSNAEKTKCQQMSKKTKRQKLENFTKCHFDEMLKQ